MSENSAQLAIVYQGPGVDSGVMSARDLADTLTATADLCERANFVLNGQHASVRVDVHSEFRRGSFELLVELIQTVPEDTRALLAEYAVRNASAILENLGLILASTTPDGLIGMLELIRRLRGRFPQDVRRGDGDRVVINGDITVNIGTLNLYRDGAVREDLERVASPIRKQGVERVEFRSPSGNQVAQTVSREDLLLLQQEAEIPIGPEELLSEAETTRSAEIVTAQFQPGLKWRFRLGPRERFTATMDDERFWDRLEAGEAFFKRGDILRMRLRHRDYTGAAGIRTETSVVEVLDLVHRPDQGELFDDGD